MASSRIASLTDFAPLAPPWQLSQLDQNSTNIIAAFNDSSLGYINAISIDTGGGANNYAVTCIFGTPTAYNAGMHIAFLPAGTNNGASVITVAPLGSLSIVDSSGNPLQAGAIQQGRVCELICFGTSFRLVNGLFTNGVPYYYDWDDFTGNPKFLVSGNSGAGSSSALFTNQIASHPGLWQLVTGATASNFAILESGPVFLDSFNWTVRSILDPSTIGSSANLIFGFDSSPGSTLTTRNGIFIFGAQGTANWQCRCSTGSANTQQDSGIAFSPGVMHDLMIVVGGGPTPVTFFIDGSLVATISSNIPANTVALHFGVFATTGAAASSAMILDTFEVLIQNIPSIGTNQRFLKGAV